MELANTDSSFGVGYATLSFAQGLDFSAFYLPHATVYLFFP